MAVGYTGKGSATPRRHVAREPAFHDGQGGHRFAGQTVTYGWVRLSSSAVISVSALRDGTGALMRLSCRVHGTDAGADGS